MIQNFIIEGDVFKARIWKDEGIFFAECQELNTTAQGRSVKMARENLKEVSRMFLDKKTK
jgi:predicted RNase H-like HicB family nuclease